MWSSLLLAFATSMLIQIILFIPAYFKRTDKLTDVSYSLTFIFLSVLFLLFNRITIANLILFLMIFLWAARLGTYLFIRINKIKKDARFDNIRFSFCKYFGFWLLQGLTVFIIILPTLIHFNLNPDFSLLLIPGLIVWILGFSIEAIADLQNFEFKKNPKNKNKFTNIGLWKYSRHPNYFGEILCWIGVYMFVFPSLTLIYRIISLISPIFIIFLLLFVSGIPILEKKADEKYKNNKEYKEYKRKTSILIPFFIKK